MSFQPYNESQTRTFRNDHKIYLLAQQLSEAKTSLQLKTKEIYYLSSQIVSLKEQYGQKILNLEKIISDDKKQLADLRIRNKEIFTKDRQKEKQKMFTIQIQLKKKFEEKIKSLEQHHRILQERLKQKHTKQLQIQKQKYETLLSIEKSSNANYEKYLEIQKIGNEDLANKMENQNKQVSQQKLYLEEQISEYLRQLSAIKKVLHNFTKQTEDKQRERILQISQLNRKIEKLQQVIQEKDEQKLQNEANHKQQIQKLIKLSERQQLEITQYKELIVKKDLEITRLINLQSASIKDTDLQKYQNSHSHYLMESTQKKKCNHQGYIIQLEKNIQLLTLDNKHLKKKLKQWGADIGIQKSLSIRLSELSEVSQEAQTIYKKFRNMLISKSENKKEIIMKTQTHNNRIL